MCYFYLKLIIFIFKTGLGKGPNNMAKLFALKLLIKPALEKGEQNLQAFGDSSVIINWMVGMFKMDSLFVLPMDS